MSVSVLVLVLASVWPTEIAFHFRKGDQPEGVNFYTLSTPGSSPPSPPSYSSSHAP